MDRELSDEERASLAEQLINNPLLNEILDDLEQTALNQCVHADWSDDRKRADAAAQVRAIRAFRSDCQSAIDNNRPSKDAPA